MGARRDNTLMLTRPTPFPHFLQVSRLLQRLVVAEEELVRVKRLCEYTALTEMRSTGEEYVKEVQRHHRATRAAFKIRSSVSNLDRRLTPFVGKVSPFQRPQQHRESHQPLTIKTLPTIFENLTKRKTDRAK